MFNKLSAVSMCWNGTAISFNSGNKLADETFLLFVKTLKDHDKEIRACGHLCAALFCQKGVIDRIR